MAPEEILIAGQHLFHFEVKWHMKRIVFWSKTFWEGYSLVECLHTNDVQDYVPWVASLYGGPGLQPQVPWLCQEYHLQGGFKCWNILNQLFVLKGMNPWISTQRPWLKILTWKWPNSLVQNWHISVQGVAFISNLAPAMEAQQWSKRRFDQQERSICDSVCYPRYLNFINQNTASCSN